MYSEWTSVGIAAFFSLFVFGQFLVSLRKVPLSVATVEALLKGGKVEVQMVGEDVGHPATYQLYCDNGIVWYDKLSDGGEIVVVSRGGLRFDATFKDGTLVGLKEADTPEQPVAAFPPELRHAVLSLLGRVRAEVTRWDEQSSVQECVA